MDHFILYFDFFMFNLQNIQSRHVIPVPYVPDDDPGCQAVPFVPFLSFPFPLPSIVRLRDPWSMPWKRSHYSISLRIPVPTSQQLGMAQACLIALAPPTSQRWEKMARFVSNPVDTEARMTGMVVMRVLGSVRQGTNHYLENQFRAIERAAGIDLPEPKTLL